MNTLLSDLEAGRIPEPSPATSLRTRAGTCRRSDEAGRAPIEALLAERGGRPRHLHRTGRRSTRAEREAGEPHGRPRVKFCRVRRDGRGGARRAPAASSEGLMAADLAEVAADDRGRAPRRRGRGDRRGRRRPSASGRQRAAVRGPARGSTSTGSSAPPSSERFDDGSIHALSIHDLRRRLSSPGASLVCSPWHPTQELKQQVEQAIAREPGSPVHEGDAGGAALRLLDAGRRRARAARRRLRGDRRAAGAAAAARGDRASSPTGRPSPSSTSTASWSAAATSSRRCSTSGELAELLGVEQPAE